MAYIITHRGIDAEMHHPFTESSRESFQYFLDKGYGLEFDIQITKDNVPIVSHDESLGRIAKQNDLPTISQISSEEFLATVLPNGHTVSLSELINMIREADSNVHRLHALHLKYQNQIDENLTILLPYLRDMQDLPIMIFDATVTTAKKIKEQLPNIQIAASVAHTYDIARYNDATGGTLISIDELRYNNNIYDWAWLDEWDRRDKNNTVKTFYSFETFKHLRSLGLNIAIVSPELHATSPKLLGAEIHPDGQNKKNLLHRWQEIALYKPDAICTDYPKSCANIFL